MKRNRLKSFSAALALALLLPGGAAAQQQGGAKWYFGLGGGYHSSHMSFSDLNEDVFPESKNRGSGVFSVFAQGEFGSQGNFAVRPQLSFLTRGGKLTDIANVEGFYQDNGLDEVFYSLRSRYIDIRVPLIWQFGRAASTVRPYVFAAPVLCFATA